MRAPRSRRSKSARTLVAVLGTLLAMIGLATGSPIGSAQGSGAAAPASHQDPLDQLVTSAGAPVAAVPVDFLHGFGHSGTGTGAQPELGTAAPAVPPGATDPLSPRGAGIESVIPPDGRTQVADTDDYPSRAIGQVSFNQGLSGYICTGYFIDEDTVATSGHCVHEGGAGGVWSTDVRFTPGRNGTGPNSAPFGTCDAVSLVTTRGWIDSRDETQDYGFIQVDGCSAASATGWFGYFATSDADLLDDPLTVRGYPGDKPTGTQWTMDDRVRALGDDMVFYQADTAGGQSGSPVYATLPSVCGGPCAMAVHGYGHPHGPLGTPHRSNNHGPRVTRPRLAEFAAAAAANGCAGNPFSDTPDWVVPAVDFMWCEFLMSGYEDSTFRPYATMTRAQVARLLYFLGGAPPVDGYPDHELNDVPAWVEDAVRWLVGEGYATGYPDKTFEPDDPISRAEVTRMEYRMSGSPPGNPPHPFTDVPRWVDEAVRWATDPGRDPQYATGYPGNLYKPDDHIDRAETTRMTCRVAGQVTC